MLKRRDQHALASPTNRKSNMYILSLCVKHLVNSLELADMIATFCLLTLYTERNLTRVQAFACAEHTHSHSINMQRYERNQNSVQSWHLSAVPEVRFCPRICVDRFSFSDKVVQRSVNK